MCDPSKGPYRCHLEPAPIPSTIMDSVSVDHFSLPVVNHNGRPYDTIQLCVDRLSGWIVAVPMNSQDNLTADIVAKTMYQQWELFGVPVVVTSDRGSLFASSWWQTMCAAHRVGTAYARAYHHNANGRTKVAGQQVIRKLRKLITDLDEPGVSWVELLPKALRLIHDTPGETGHSSLP